MIATENILKHTVLQALETMAFLTELPLEEDAVVPQQCILSQIDFSGPKEGTISILAGRRFAETLAQNMGALDDVDDQICGDAMKELANVTSGLLLPMISSCHGDIFDISVPYIKTENQSWLEFVSKDNACILNIERNLIAVSIKYQQ
jgi:CheY-specific phosphatase CheX